MEIDDFLKLDPNITYEWKKYFLNIKLFLLAELLQTEEIRCTAGHVQSIRCAFVLGVPCKENWCTVDLSSA